MAYETYRVEVTRDETLPEGGVAIEITAYFDRLPETHEYTIGRLTRAPRGVWNTRLQFAGDFATLGDALAAIAPRFRRPTASAATNTRSTTNSRSRCRRSSAPTANGARPASCLCLHLGRPVSAVIGPGSTG